MQAVRERRAQLQPSAAFFMYHPISPGECSQDKDSSKNNYCSNDAVQYSMMYISFTEDLDKGPVLWHNHHLIFASKRINAFTCSKMQKSQVFLHLQAGLLFYCCFAQCPKRAPCWTGSNLLSIDEFINLFTEPTTICIA